MTVTTDRAAPIPPGDELWAAAQDEFTRGKVFEFAFNVNGEMVPVTVTAGWIAAWRDAPLTLQQRLAIKHACTQISRDRVHPCLGKRGLVIDGSGEAWMASPCPGVTVTWRAHWSQFAVPVMMTLTYDPILDAALG